MWRGAVEHALPIGASSALQLASALEVPLGSRDRVLEGDAVGQQLQRIRVPTRRKFTGGVVHRVKSIVHDGNAQRGNVHTKLVLLAACRAQTLERVRLS